MTAQTVAEKRALDRHKIAALLSIVPGLGHLYKHHYLTGFGFLIGGNLLVIFLSGLMVLGTFGLSAILLPAAYVLSVAVAAYFLPDWHGHHHYLHPWTPVRPDPPEPGGPVD